MSNQLICDDRNEHISEAMLEQFNIEYIDFDHAIILSFVLSSTTIHDNNSIN